MSSDYFHCESLSDQGLDAKDPFKIRYRHLQNFKA